MQSITIVHVLSEIRNKNTEIRKKIIDFYRWVTYNNDNGNTYTKTERGELYETTRNQRSPYKAWIYAARYGSDDDGVAFSPFKQLTAEEFEEVKKADISGVKPVEKTIPLDELYSTQPTNKMSRLQRVYEHFQDDPESLYENIARPAGFMETPNKTIRVYKINGKDVIADGNHRLVIMAALGDKSAKVEYYDLDKQKQSIS